MVVKTKYDKTNVETSDYIDQYCDHRDTCKYQGKQCILGIIPKRINKAEMAYADARHCKLYRPDDEGIMEADVIEIGVWK